MTIIRFPHINIIIQYGDMGEKYEDYKEMADDERMLFKDAWVKIGSTLPVWVELDLEIWDELFLKGRMAILHDLIEVNVFAMATDKGD